MITYFSQFINIGDPEVEGDERIVTLLDTPGLWKAIITLVGGSGVYNVTGIATFNVDGDEGSEEENEADASVIIQGLINRISQKLNIRQGFVILSNLDADVSTYAVGQLFFVKSETNFYQKEADGELREYAIFNPDNQFVTVEDHDYPGPMEEEENTR
mgnify:CR=1 FL=1